MYNVGDRVRYGHKKHKARVLKVWSNGDYMIEFDDNTLIPPQMDVPEMSLSQEADDIFALWDKYHSDILGKNTDNCSRCGNKWTETWIGHQPFYDCLKCNIKREDS